MDPQTITFTTDSKDNVNVRLQRPDGHRGACNLYPGDSYIPAVPAGEHTLKIIIETAPDPGPPARCSQPILVDAGHSYLITADNRKVPAGKAYHGWFLLRDDQEIVEIHWKS